MAHSHRSFRDLVVAVLASSAIAAVVGSAGAADLARPVETPIAGLPFCGDDGILDTIRSRFSYGARMVERRDLELVTIERIHQTDVSVDDPSPIARRTCAADVSLSDGSGSRLAYRIERSAGFAAPGLFDLPSNVEFCVLGHDPWRVQDGDCRYLTRFW
jgi:hypothetical protein